VPTNTPVGSSPTQGPVVINQPSPSTTAILGARTPGPTPQAPATGTGAAGEAGFNLLAAVAGLLALGSGMFALGVARRR
jgi:hypothetical protein